MSKVQILVPAPIRHVPPKVREARTGYAPMVEDVDLRELSLVDAPRGPDLPANGGKAPVVTRLVDGAAWRPIGCDDAFGEATKAAPGQPRPDGAAFVAWLGGDRTAGDAFDNYLLGTPLLARVPGRGESLRPDAPWNAARQGALLLDGRELMPGLVRRYVADNVAMIGGMPFVRMIGPMCYLTGGERAFEHSYRAGTGLAPPDKARVSLIRRPGGWTTNSALNYHNAYRHDRLGDIARVTRIEKAWLRPDWSVRELSGLRLRDDDDLELMLREGVRMLVANEPRHGYAIEPGILEGLRRDAALGSVGALGGDDLPRAWASLRNAAAAIAGSRNAGWGIGQARRIQVYADAIALPRVAGRVHDAAAEDVEALSGLSPA